MFMGYVLEDAGLMFLGDAAQERQRLTSSFSQQEIGL